MTTTPVVPGTMPCAINGRPYILDDTEGAYRRRSIPVTRQQFDTKETAGEQSLTSEGAWRRSFSSWHHGAGQTSYDRSDSLPTRYRSSKGIDPWTKWQFSLLSDTTSKRTSANQNLELAVDNLRLWISDGNEVYSTASLTGAPTWTAANINVAEGAQSVQSITSDGYNLWAGVGSNGIHYVRRDAPTVGVHYNALTGQTVRFVKGRLMAAVNNSIYNVTASGAAPAALFTHDNTDFVFRTFAAGATHIYAGGISGDKTEIYKITITAAGTSLAAPTIAGTLPDGETLTEMYGYLGFIFLGTSKGVRFCTVDGEGNLTIGALIPMTFGVRAFEGQDRFVWFNWSFYDASSTGLGRLDLSNFTDSDKLTPAYASDLMAPTAIGADVLAIATFQSTRVFAVSEAGLYAESTNKVASGTLDTGLITYGITDQKVALALDVTHKPLVGSHTDYLSTDEGAFVAAGTTHSTAGEIVGSYALNSRGTVFELRHTLTRSAALTTGPTYTQVVLKAYPSPTSTTRGRTIVLPLILAESIQAKGNSYAMDPQVELDALEAMEGTLVEVQIANSTFNAFVESVDFRATHLTMDNKAFAGVAALTIKKLT